MRIKDLKGELLKRLSPLENPHLEARLLLSHFLGLSDIQLITRQDQETKPDAAAKILKAADERLEGRPMAYITGEKEFYGYQFHVTEDVLIPQPDTETLVETALSLLKKKENASVLDLCTGSGAIITSLKLEKPEIAAFFSDISKEALKIAEDNYSRLTGENAEARWGDLFSPWTGFSFDMITANPPYVTEKWYEDVSEEVKREPKLAIVDSAHDGLGITGRIIREAPKFLKDDGILILEADYRQHEEIRKLLLLSGFGDIKTERDLAGLERVSYGRKR